MKVEFFRFSLSLVYNFLKENLASSLIKIGFKRIGVSIMYHRLFCTGISHILIFSSILTARAQEMKVSLN